LEPSVPKGELEILGLMPAASNYTFLARVKGDAETLVVYKPRRGETPLWDFEQGTLCQREVAAHLVAQAAGWGFVPSTVLADGPLGPGSVQLFIDHDPSVTAFKLAGKCERELRQIAVFDLIANNADRKAGHVFIDASGAVWGVDHGLCFHPEPKLRTVLWDYVGNPIPEEDLEAVENLRHAVEDRKIPRLEELLFPEEIKALKVRAEWVLEQRAFPPPGRGRAYPWPPI
jgi:uncharacterized repeat protein (TIGR03843 family)